MYKYRIKVEAICEGECKAMLDERLTEGIECNGFAILGDRDHKQGVVVKHDVNDIDIAGLIAEDADMLSASLIAKAMKDAYELKKKERAGNLFGKRLNLDCSIAGATRRHGGRRCQAGPRIPAQPVQLRQAPGF